MSCREAIFLKGGEEKETLIQYELSRSLWQQKKTPRRSIILPQMTVTGPPDCKALPYRGVNPERIDRQEKVMPKLPNAESDRSNDYFEDIERLEKINNFASGRNRHSREKNNPYPSSVAQGRLDREKAGWNRRAASWSNARESVIGFVPACSRVWPR